MKLLLVLLLNSLLLTGVSRAEDAATEAPLPSPYFIDGIHCEGPRVRSPPGFFVPEDQRETAKRIEAQEDCEKIASVFGVQKFMWLTPEDLERFTEALRQSGYFKDVDVSLKKSELRNHVHLFLKLKPGRPFHFTVSDAFELQNGQNGQSPRLFNRLSGEATDKRYDPLFGRAYGFSLESSGASQSLPGLLPQSSQSNYYYSDFYVSGKGTYSKSLSAVVDVHAILHNLDTAEKLRADTMVHGDLLYTETFFNYYMTIQFGASGIFTTYATTPDGYASTLIPGLKVALLLGKEGWDYLKFDFSFYHAVGMNSAIDDTNIYGQKHVSWLFDQGFVVGGYHARDVRNALLPHDQLLFSSLTKSDVYIGVGKSFVGDKRLQQGALNFGAQEWQQREGGFNQTSPYLSLSYAFSSEDWDIKIQASYCFQRIY